MKATELPLLAASLLLGLVSSSVSASASDTSSSPISTAVEDSFPIHAVAAGQASGPSRDSHRNPRANVYVYVWDVDECDHSCEDHDFARGEKCGMCPCMSCERQDWDGGKCDKCPDSWKQYYDYFDDDGDGYDDDDGDGYGDDDGNDDGDGYIYDKDGDDDGDDNNGDGYGYDSNGDDDDDNKNNGKDDDDDDSEKSIPPNVAYCEKDTDVTDSSAVDVGWYFVVETSVAESLYLEQLVAESLRDVMFFRMHYEHCKERRQLLRRLKVQGFSNVTSKAEWPCKPSNAGSVSCTTYSSQMSVVHDGEEPSDDVEAGVLAIAEEELSNGKIKAQVNDKADDIYGSVTLVSFGEGADMSKNPTTAGITGSAFQSEKRGLSKAGKVAVSMIAVIVALFVIVFCWLRQRRKNRQETMERSSKQSVGTHDDDNTWANDGDGESPTGSPSRNNKSLDTTQEESYEVEADDDADDDGSYQSSDFNNLGLHHSKLNVHRCTSATCDTCNPGQGPDPSREVSFISSRSGFLASIKEDRALSSSGKSDSQYAEEIQEVPEIERYTTGGGGSSFFSRLRRPTAPDTVIRQAGAGNSKEEVEI